MLARTPDVNEFAGARRQRELLTHAIPPAVDPWQDRSSATATATATGWFGAAAAALRSATAAPPSALWLEPS